jgi:outer membrane protein assembly factor BamE (lipoprotein component of BamABCDE complex)
MPVGSGPCWGQAKYTQIDPGCRQEFGDRIDAFAFHKATKSDVIFQARNGMVHATDSKQTSNSPRGQLMKRTWIAFGVCLLVAAAGCGEEKAEIKEDRLTVGKVQGEVKVGMPASQVVELLGSPNIVTTDEKRREVWVYDKVSTDRVDTASSSFAGLIILGGSSSDRSSSQRQRTLTIIIKYDEEKKVRDFAYNYTQF